MDVKSASEKKIYEKIRGFAPIIQPIARLIIGFLLSRGVIFAEYAPFGMAWCSTTGMWGTIGAVLGYISILNRANGLKYMAISIMIYTAWYVFRDTELIKRKFFMTIATFVCTASIGLIFVIESDDPIRAGVFYVAEVIFTTLCSYFYGVAQKGRQTLSQKIGLWILAVTLILPLSSVQIAGISLGRIIAVTFIMIGGYYGGMGMGSAAGITFAFGAGDVYLSPVYGIAGLIAPFFKTKGRIFYGVAFYALAISAMIWVTLDLKWTVAVEFLLSLSAFSAISTWCEDKITPLFKEKEANYDFSRVQNYISEQITGVSEALEELSMCFLGRKEEERQSFASVFDVPLQKVCKNCILAKTCWEKDFIETKDAIDYAKIAMERKSELEKDDFPPHFRARCIKIDAFLETANIELFKVIYRKKCKAQINESKGLIKKQYGEMARIVNSLKDQVNLTFDRKCEAKIQDFFQRNEIYARPTVFRDAERHIRIEIEGKDAKRLCNEAFARDLSAFLGFKVTIPFYNSEKESATLKQKENLRTHMGITACKKEGNKVCGDAGSYFRMGNGSMGVILADGMGSGKDAAYISSKAIKMIERFCRAKIDMRLSLSVINSALVLKGEEDGGFTTVDFLELNLYSGKGRLYKLGSAPTYICRKGKVQRINSLSLPAGVPSPSKNTAECFNLQIYPGDFIVFVTDGVSDAADDEWLCELIANYQGESPKELASEIVTSAIAKYGKTDDMTALVVYADKNR